MHREVPSWNKDLKGSRRWQVTSRHESGRWQSTGSPQGPPTVTSKGRGFQGPSGWLQLCSCDPRFRDCKSGFTVQNWDQKWLMLTPYFTKKSLSFIPQTPIESCSGPDAVPGYQDAGQEAGDVPLCRVMHQNARWREALTDGQCMRSRKQRTTDRGSGLSGVKERLVAPICPSPVNQLLGSSSRWYQEPWGLNENKRAGTQGTCM